MMCPVCGAEVTGESIRCPRCGRVLVKEEQMTESTTESTEVSTWVDRAMYEAEPMPGNMPRVTLLSATPDPLGAIAAFAFMYKGRVIRSLAELTDKEREWAWEQANATHLKAPLEAVDLHFMVEGVTRAFTHQMVRQRTAVYAQESLRFAVKEEIAARPGPITSVNHHTHDAWQQAVNRIWEAYKGLIAAGVPAEEARGLLPHDTLTRLNYKTNLRNLVDHLGNRLCTQAQFEWRMVASQMRMAIHNYEPPVIAGVIREMKSKEEFVAYQESQAWQFRKIADSDLFRPVCFALGHCPFGADFDRGCTIRERVNEGKFDEIEPREWIADPTAGWVRN